MLIRLILLSCFSLIGLTQLKAQCAASINTFPFIEGFEVSNGGWTSGGTGSDWAWGSPTKSVITAAGGGANCWVIGGLTGG